MKMKLKTLLPTFFILFTVLQSTTQIEFIPAAVKSKFGDALEAIFGMGVRLQVLLGDPSTAGNENFLISPLSAAITIGQLMLGAEGEFRQQLYDLLSLPKKGDGKYSLKAYGKDGKNETYIVPHMELHLQLLNLMRALEKELNKHYKLTSANVLFVDRKLQLKGEFDYESKFLYDTEFIKMNFNKPAESLLRINNWAYNHTNGLIPTLLSIPPSQQTSAIFANAIYFLGEWEQPFSAEINTKQSFYITPDKDTEVTFMNGLLEGIPYMEHKRLNCKMISLPYKERELGMYIVLPNEAHKHKHNIRAFASDFKSSDFLDMIEKLKDRDVNVRIPKLNLSTTLQLLRPLQKYALYKKMAQQNNQTSFNGTLLDVLDKNVEVYNNFRADQSVDLILSAAAENNQLKISDLLQQMTFAINEKGTEAAVITAGTIDYMGGIKNFNANRPFLFFIRHEKTAATLFWGTISNPNA